MDDKFDKSFNQGVYNRVEKFAKESGVKYRKTDITNETQPGQAIPRIAQRGANPVLSVGFTQASAVAKEFPNVRFP
jgi:basic membrane protein A